MISLLGSLMLQWAMPSLLRTSAVGSLPASTSLYSSREPVYMLFTANVRKFWCFSSQGHRGSYMNTSQVSLSFLIGPVSSCFSLLFRTNTKYTWKHYHIYQTLALRKLTKPKELISCLLTIQHEMLFAAFDLITEGCNVITTFAVVQVNSLTRCRQANLSRGVFSWSHVSFGFLFAPPAAADTSHTLPCLRQMQMSVSVLAPKQLQAMCFVSADCSSFFSLPTLTSGESQCLMLYI